MAEVPGFHLASCDAADIDDIIGLVYSGGSNDILQQLKRPNATLESILPKLRVILRPRFGEKEGPAKGWENIKIVETATGRLVAWTSLLFPRVKTAEEKAAAAAEEEEKKKQSLAEPPSEDRAARDAVGKALDEASLDFGYDPEKHFHRKGTSVEVDFQRRGLGKWMTAHMNAIADEAGAATFLGSRPKGIGMFTSMGFRTVGELRVDLSRWGMDEVVHPTMRRDPGGRCEAGEANGVKVTYYNPDEQDKNH